MKVVLSMPFLIFTNADVQFAKKKLTWRTYTTKKALPTTRQVKPIDQKKFAKTMLNRYIKAFMCMLAPWNQEWLSTQREKLSWLCS